MRKIGSIVILVMFALTAQAGLHTYAGKSRLSEGHFVKIRVGETGVYKLTYEELQQMGLQPEQVRVYGYGGAMLQQSFLQRKIDDLPAVPIYMDKGSDGKFGKGDYILFYAQGPVAWRYTGTRFIHTKNTYSNYGYYFLSDDAGEQLLLQGKSANVSSLTAQDVTTYSHYQVHEVDSLNMLDKTGKEGGGREFYGERIEVGLPLVLQFDSYAVVPETELYVCVDMAPDTQKKARFVIKAGNGEKTVDVEKSNSDIYQKALTLNTDGYFAVQTGNKQYVELSCESATSSAGAYLNYVELTAICRMALSDGILYLRNVEHYMDDTPSRFHITNATANTQVWEVTDLDSIRSVATEYSNGELQFVSGNERVREYVVIEPAQYQALRPVANSKGIEYEKVETQNLHGLRNIDMVIIANSKLRDAAVRLADAHTEEGLVTVAVTADEVYNEFSSGTPDATAYRWIMKMLYDRANASEGKETAPRYLLLLGDGTYDNRKLLYASGQNTLLTYQAQNSTIETFAYATDDYFGFLDDNTGSDDLTDQMAVSVGRLPVNTAEDADRLVDKIIRYMRNENPGSWKTHVCFLADDGDSNGHTKGADRAAEIVRKLNPELIVDKIFIDAYQQSSDAAGEHYVGAKNKLDNLLASGVIFFNYCGHAGYNNLASEQMLTTKEIREMTNSNLGFWMLATCEFGRFDAQVTSAAEESVLNPNGGCIGLMASCRTVYETQNERLNEMLCRYLFTRDDNNVYPHTIGESVQMAKNDYAAYWKDKNKLPYILLCDPALRLHYPDDYKLIIDQMPDTLKALSKHSFKGYVLEHNGDTAKHFNGIAHITLFDKLQQITTYDNDQPNEEKKQKYTYVDYPNTIFNGTTQISNGQFEVNLMIPKDIRYNYGEGHLTLYANDTIDGTEAMGYDNSFIIGGSNPLAVTDTLGPELSVWLNNPAFVSGGTTGEQPHFYASISDENGINTIGNGIGHDLLLVVDNDLKQAYVLNDYYIARSGSYQEGTVSYRLPKLSVGEHTLTFKVWDLLNNSSTASLDFVVEENPNPIIFSLQSYPNPVGANAEVSVRIEHDSPDQLLQCIFLLYDMTGQLIWEYEQSGADTIRFVPAAKGMHSGIYFYRVRIKTDTSEYTSKTSKMIVN